MNNFTNESEAQLAAEKLCEQDKLPNGYVALFNPNQDGFCIYPCVSTLLFKAFQTGTLLSKDRCIFQYDNEGKLVSASVTIQRLIFDQPRTFEGDEVFLAEYADKQWHKDKPHMFLAKTALAVALRQAFPDVLAGLVSAEEAKCELDFSGGTAAKQAKTVKQQDLSLPTPNEISVADIVSSVFGNK